MPQELETGPDTVLNKLLSGETLRSSNFGLNIEQLAIGEVVELHISNHDQPTHAFTLHGHWLWVMARGRPRAGVYERDRARLTGSPMLRDTVSVNVKSYLVVRFVANNPGVWVCCCIMFCLIFH